jgi:parallel beta-helix repeat protein
MLLIILFAGISKLAFNIERAIADGTIYILDDGRIVPPTAPISTVDKTTYVFTDNINSSIVINRTNIVLDGAGYTANGGGISILVDLVTVRNINIKNCYFGISLSHLTTDSAFYNNNITDNTVGILAMGLANCSFHGNNLANNEEVAIWIFNSTGCTFYGNKIINTSYGPYYGYGIWVSGSSLNDTFSRNNITNSRRSGILITDGNNVTVSENIINRSMGYGISVSADFSTITRNKVTNIEDTGISGGYDSTISENTIVDSMWGAGMSLFHRSRAFGNEIKNNAEGIRVYGHDGEIFENNITNNKKGIILEGSNNRIYHNNIINNTVQVQLASIFASANILDDGYPGGGNYWSDYVGFDEENGPNQDQLGSDGIGDTPYIGNLDNMDRYPLMNPWGSVPALETDLNKDGTVDILDIFIVARAFHSKLGDANWKPIADLDHNDQIDILDIFRVARDFGKTSLPSP